MLLDTHVWIWMVTGNKQLSKSGRDSIVSKSAEHDLYLSPISLWEISLKASRNQLELEMPLRTWMRHAIAQTGIRLAEITPDIACACAELPAEFHGDPADRLIAATARSEGMTLMTHDRALLALAKQGHFKAFAA